MLYQEFQDNYQIFNQLLINMPKVDNPRLTTLVNSYAEQNIMVVNELLATSIANLQRLQKAHSCEEVMAIQSRFSSEVGQKLSLSAQRFLNVSLGHIADYNEWLKANAELATD